MRGERGKECALSGSRFEVASCYAIVRYSSISRPVRWHGIIFRMITRRQIFDVEHVREEASPKQIALASIFLFATFALAILLFLVLGGHIGGAATVVGLLVIAFVWTILLGLVLSFLEPFLALIVFSVAMAVLLILFGLHSILAVVAVLAVFWGMLHAYRNAATERALLVSFRPFRILRRGFPPFFLGLSLFLAIIYQGFILEGAFSDEGSGISMQTYERIFRPVESVLQTALPGYEIGMSIGSVQDLVNVDFVGSEVAERSFKDVSFEYVNANIQALLAPYRDLLPIFFVVGLFFVFQFLSLPFRWLAIGATLLVIKVLVLYNIATVQETRVVKEERVLH